jgi:hypothetical protein
MAAKKRDQVHAELVARFRPGAQAGAAAEDLQTVGPPPASEPPKIGEGQLDLATCRELLGAAGDGLSDEELGRLRTELYWLAEPAVDIILERLRKGRLEGGPPPGPAASHVLPNEPTD